MALSYTIHQRPPEWQDRILAAHVARGYTHFMIDWPGARKDGLSVEQFVDVAKRVKDTIPFCHVMLAAKNLDPQDAGWDVLESHIAPVLTALIDAQAVDLVSPWESNLWQGAKFQSNLDGIAKICIPAGVDPWVHFGTGTLWWGAYANRVEFWETQTRAAMQARTGLDAPTLVGVLYQGDVNWDIGLRQARMDDTLNNSGAAPHFADGTFRFCAAEMDGMNIYTTNFSEDLGDMRGYLDVCTHGLTFVSGYCSGGRRPDGSVL